MYSLAGRSFGLCPYLGFVESSFFTWSSRLFSHGGTVFGISVCFLLCELEKRRAGKYKSLVYCVGDFAVFSISCILPAASKAEVTSSSDAPRLMSSLSGRTFTWFMLTLFLFTEVTFLGPVTRTKLLSITSIITHFLPASRPAVFSHILPISTAGVFLASLLKRL